MDFERLLELHSTYFKKLIKWQSSGGIVHNEKKNLERNSIELMQGISNLFNSDIMGQRFQKIWEEYLTNVYLYIDAVYTPNIAKDFGDNKAYRKAFSALTKLRKNSGELIGFFTRYLNNRHGFKTGWINFIQSLKDSIDDGVKIFRKKGSPVQFRKSMLECKLRAKEFGRLINRFR